MKRTFSISGALIWSSIQLSIKTLNINQFKSKLKNKLLDILKNEDDFIRISDIRVDIYVFDADINLPRLWQKMLLATHVTKEWRNRQEDTNNSDSSFDTFLTKMPVYEAKAAKSNYNFFDTCDISSSQSEF